MVSVHTVQKKKYSMYVDVQYILYGWMVTDDSLMTVD
jgi:hypothetical protein